MLCLKETTISYHMGAVCLTQLLWICNLWVVKISQVLIDLENKTLKTLRMVIQLY